MTLIDNMLSWFPSLQGAPGTAPFNAQTLDAWASTLPPTAAARHAAQFVLSLHADRPWRVGPFDPVEAMRTWAQPELVGYVRWARMPYMTGGWSRQQRAE
jgi:hypothetical protein